ncbi:MAG TPA: polysaccharide biosynthesis/export family protein [Rhizomicrobium sp.]|nr:polysaccharide biosynthesis/export family protein [Rhizomicrobium sp.]
MGLSLPLLLTRAATVLLAGMLLFAVFGGRAHAQDQPQNDGYGLKRFPGDNYDSAPVRFSPPSYKQVPVTPDAPAQRLSAATPVPYYPRPDNQPGIRQSGVRQPGAGYDYLLGPADKLKLTVFGEPDLSGDFTIDGAGSVRLPLIGEVRAAGFSSQQLEGAVANALSQGYLKSPRVAVEVLTYRPFYIIGAVNRPGQYAYVDHMNALNAVALAGGFNTQAVESVVFIRREGSNKEEEMPADRSTPIYPGDVVKVHTTIFSDLTTWLAPFSGAAASAATAAIIY